MKHRSHDRLFPPRSDHSGLTSFGKLLPNIMRTVRTLDASLGARSPVDIIYVHRRRIFALMVGVVRGAQPICNVRMHLPF